MKSIVQQRNSCVQRSVDIYSKLSTDDKFLVGVVFSHARCGSLLEAQEFYVSTVPDRCRSEVCELFSKCGVRSFETFESCLLEAVFLVRCLLDTNVFDRKGD